MCVVYTYFNLNWFIILFIESSFIAIVNGARSLENKDIVLIVFWGLMALAEGGMMPGQKREILIGFWTNQWEEVAEFGYVHSWTPGEVIPRPSFGSRQKSLFRAAFRTLSLTASGFESRTRFGAATGHSEATLNGPSTNSLTPITTQIVGKQQRPVLSGISPPRKKRLSLLSAAVQTKERNSLVN